MEVQGYFPIDCNIELMNRAQTRSEMIRVLEEMRSNLLASFSMGRNFHRTGFDKTNYYLIDIINESLNNYYVKIYKKYLKEYNLKIRLSVRNSEKKMKNLVEKKFHIIIMFNIC